MAIAAVSYRQQLASERTAGMRRIDSGRGKVLTGFGGDLAGYNQSLIKQRADMEDQLIQKKYSNGQITLDELITHLRNSGTRSWVTPEQRALIDEQVKELEQNKLDEVIANQYKAGTITARQVAAYTKGKLAKLNAGSPVYQNLQSEAAGWDKKANEEDLSLAEQQAMTSASGMEDGAEQQLALEKAYNDLAEKAKGYGMEQEALAYQQKANNAKFKIDAYKEQETTASAKVQREGLINRLNLAINDYHDNNIGATDFLATLDQLQTEAVNNGQSDLLDTMNKWVDATREDMAYGKAWDRGGTRTGGIKSGSGGGTGTGTGGGSWDTQDKLYKDNIRQLQNELTSGKISADQYKSDLSDVLNTRAQDIQERMDSLSEMPDTARVKYQGVNQQVGNIIEKLDKELNSNWGAPLGLSESEAGNVGLVAMSEDFTSNQGAFVPVMNIVGTGPGARPSISFEMLTPELEANAVKDTSGVYHTIKSNSVQKNMLSQEDYMALPEDQKMNYNIDANGQWVEKTKPTKRYVDIYGEDGSQIRYYVDGQNKIIDWESNIGDKSGLSDGQSNYKEALDLPTNFDTPAYIVERAREKREASLANPATALTTPVTPLNPIRDAASDKLAAEAGVMSSTKLPQNIPIKPVEEVQQRTVTPSDGGFSNGGSTTNSGNGIPQPNQPSKSTQSQLTDPTKPSQTNQSLLKALGPNSIKLDPKITGPAPTRQSLDDEYAKQQEADKAMFASGNASGKPSLWSTITKKVSSWFGK